jgi:uncharacterized protein (DUF362 family)
MTTTKSQVALCRTGDRQAGVIAAIETLGRNPVKNRDVLIKPNFNTADPAPGSTHNDTLIALVDEIWRMGAKTIRLGERSYPPTKTVMAQKKIVPLLEERDVQVIDFDDLGESDWVKVKPEGSHWPDGFRVARPVIESECLVSTGCLKTHQFGGVFTLSLKLHVGVVPTYRNGFDYMTLLHGSMHQCQMIAEINVPFRPQMIVLDGVEAFVGGGPATGKRVKADVMLAADDRVAIDAVGVAVLKTLGSNEAIMNRAIFDQEQIARAVELNLGAPSPDDIDLMATDKESRTFTAEVERTLLRG